MKEHYLDTHSDSCIEYSKSGKDFANFCKNNPERFIVFIGGEFMIITYNKCHIRYEDRYDYQIRIIQALFKKYKTYEVGEINKSVRVEEDLKNYRIRNQSLRKYIYQANCVYKDTAGREYAIATHVKYIDAIADYTGLRERYDDAVEFLIKNEYVWMAEELKSLYMANMLYDYDPAEIYKTIDHLVEQINKTIKQKNN